MNDSNLIKPIIDDLVYRAQASPGVLQSYTYEDGLRVDVLIDSRQTILRISFEDTFPTVVEYWKFLKEWPYKVEVFKPQAVAHSGRYFLSGSWPTPTE